MKKTFNDYLKKVIKENAITEDGEQVFKIQRPDPSLIINVTTNEEGTEVGDCTVCGLSNINRNGHMCQTSISPVTESTKEEKQPFIDEIMEIQKKIQKEFKEEPYYWKGQLEATGIEGLNGYLKKVKAKYNKLAGIKENKDNLIDYKIPAWAIASLINGDDSALNDEEIEKINKFTAKVVAEYGNAFFLLGDSEGDDNLGFCYSNDIDNMGSDCETLYINPSKTNESIGTWPTEVMFSKSVKDVTGEDIPMDTVLKITQKGSNRLELEHKYWLSIEDFEQLFNNGHIEAVSNESMNESTSDLRYELAYTIDNCCGMRRNNSPSKLIEWINKQKGVSEWALYKNASGFHSTTQDEYLVNWWDKGNNYWSNRSKNEPKLLNKKYKTNTMKNENNGVENIQGRKNIQKAYKELCDLKICDKSLEPKTRPYVNSWRLSVTSNQPKLKEILAKYDFKIDGVGTINGNNGNYVDVEYIVNGHGIKENMKTKKLNERVGSKLITSIKEFKMIKESGEWDDNDEDMTASKEMLQTICDQIEQDCLGFDCKSVNGFDKYQGPYATCSFKDKHFTIWLSGEADVLSVENWPNAGENWVGTSDEFVKEMISITK